MTTNEWQPPKIRTQEEIVLKLRDKEFQKDDVFSVMRGDLVEFLDYNNAEEFLKDGVTSDDWKRARATRTSLAVIAMIAEYMPFAWKKANASRGLSALRSLMHMRAWLWLLGFSDEKIDRISPSDYRYYGKPNLVAICENFDVAWEQWDNDEWRNDETSPHLTALEALGRD